MGRSSSKATVNKFDKEVIIRDEDNKEVRPATICEKRKERLSALFS
jgi:hypothetical protein